MQKVKARTRIIETLKETLDNANGVSIIKIISFSSYVHTGVLIVLLTARALSRHEES